MTNEIASIRLKLILDGLLDVLRSNQLSTTIPSNQKFLYRVFNGIVIGKYNFYTEAVSLITRTPKDPNRLETRMMFDIDRANMPTVHIHMPSDNQGGENNVGMNLRYDADIMEETLGRTFTGMYDLIITSPNPLEVQLLYELLMSLLIAGKDTFNHYFIKFNYSGKELMANPNIVPMNTFMKAITIKLDYERRVPKLNPDLTILNVLINGQTVP